MYRGFTLKGLEIDDYFDKCNYFSRGLDYYEGLNRRLQKVIRRNVLSDTVIDGTAIQSAWFPEVKADVFISHSHKNENLAITLSGLLMSEFNLKPFVDSCVWGYADVLLREIDDQYNTYVDRVTRKTMYDYKRRNYSTSHVHMMLTSALRSMIDRSEALIFLETTESLTFRDGEQRTYSPWLYAEIGITQTIQKTLPPRHIVKDQTFSKALLESTFDPDYRVSLSHLTPITSRIVDRWVDLQRSNTKAHPLDKLYSLKPLPKVSNTLFD